MKFALLLFDPEDYWDSVSEEEMGAAVAEHAAFAAYLRERGIPFSGEALKPAAEARSLRPSGDGPVAADEPFMALRQDLAGFYLIECAGLDEAEEIARRCPIGAGIEIRPVWEA
ncbi:YciI family protein [Nonomuraea terrae]|uniref:YciI family protein n=1 Tax=Nonomuraea terrae TaxID=2530383 RepID=UPI0037992893